MTADESAASFQARIGWATGAPLRPTRDFLAMYRILEADPSVLPTALKQGGLAVLGRFGTACAGWTQRDVLFVLAAVRNCGTAATRQTLSGAVRANVLERCTER